MKHQENDKIILDTSDGSAKFVMGISGWIDRHGNFFGKDEKLARWSGATHTHCQSCGKPTTKGWTKCNECREVDAKMRYSLLPKKVWNGEPVYSEVVEEYFFDEDSVLEYCEMNDVEINDLRLVFCEPKYATQIDPNEYYNDLLPEDGELDAILSDAFEALNKIIREHKEPLSWEPGKIAVA